ncbi:basic membrane protein A [Austwickia chelonae]|uniref:Putative ABC transporter substrate-binding protein n=1 Tax=Austwickia chelonae NBRC 105200 TaxID=1184607 RepID=K6VJ86_9MICO|nr:BMP family ABC transporter substrate-binding protein [Austwickia chelonae]GAB76799.1 putative ABC transporter substrate-binding protein [Austwickia chelonae NBRC 105200]SEW30865.1 basic membrane protein A [Austwickia chelonae]
MRHTTAAVAVLAAASLVLAGCGGADSKSGSGEKKTDGKGLKVALAFDVGGRGDQSFNDSAARGTDKAKAEFGGEVKDSTATPGESESSRENRLQQLIDSGYTTIVAVGFAYKGAVDKVAKDNPNAKFAIVDSSDAQGPNIANIVFAEHEGSYLAGVAAAKKSKSGNIGFVGGVQTDLIKKFEAGYTAGAKSVKPDIKIQSKYLTQAPDYSGFSDPAKGKTAAEGMLSAGADVIYHAAGGSGPGVFTAVKAKKAMAIGVDSDQAKTAAPDVQDIIITSMVKNVDVGVYDFLKSVKDGAFKNGAHSFDLKSKGVSLSTTGGKIDDIKAEIDKAKQEIIDGKVKVPSTN